MRSNRNVEREAKKRQKMAKTTGATSLYPLDPETAIKAILETGPHPKDDPSANRPDRPARQKRKDT